MWECYHKGMSKQKLVAYVVIGAAGLVALYLLTTSPGSPFASKAFQSPIASDNSCTDLPPIEGLHESSIAQLKQLAAYQEVCGSAITKTLVASEESNLDQLRQEAHKYGMTVRTVKELQTDQEVNWLMVSTESAAPTATRERKLQAATDEAALLQKQGKQVGFYLRAGGEQSYFGESEPMFKAFLTKWHDMGIRLGLSDQGEYADLHEHGQ